MPPTEEQRAAWFVDYAEWMRQRALVLAGSLAPDDTAYLALTQRLFVDTFDESYASPLILKALGVRQ